MSMHGKEGPPPLEERFRIPLRMLVIVAGYLLYYFLSDEAMIPAIFLGLGSVLIGLSLVDRWTVRRSDRSGLLQVGTTLLGIGLLLLGAFLYLR